jgi:hypothetical protein
LTPDVGESLSIPFASNDDSGFEIMMRGFASSLLRSLTVALYGSRPVYSRRDEMEFPLASQNACNLLELTFRGRRAMDRAFLDALRPYNNSVNIEDQYELSFIRETPASCARWVPTKERSSAAPSKRRRESSQENILAASGLAFWKRKKHKETGHGIPQRFGTITARAQT